MSLTVHAGALAWHSFSEVSWSSCSPQPLPHSPSYEATMCSPAKLLAISDEARRRVLSSSRNHRRTALHLRCWTPRAPTPARLVAHQLVNHPGRDGAILQPDREGVAQVMGAMQVQLGQLAPSHRQPIDAPVVPDRQPRACPTRDAVAATRAAEHQLRLGHSRPGAGPWRRPPGRPSAPPGCWHRSWAGRCSRPEPAGSDTTVSGGAGLTFHQAEPKQ